MKRVVLDTNVVLSALLFAGRLAWLRQAWQGGRLQPLLCKETADELLRVLGYPKFQLAAKEQQALLGDFLPYAQVLRLPTPWPALPPCRDAKDRPFLALALAGRAEALVSGDADILALGSTFAVPICNAEALLAMLSTP